MKGLDKYILEKFQITKDSKCPYSCQPKDRDELRNILEKRLAEDKDADLNDIDVSLVDNMFELFRNLNPHNIKIDRWDVSNVKDMRGMFFECLNFNSNVSDWDVSNAIYTSAMFWACEKFKGEGLEKWKLIKCKSMDWMFAGCNSLKKKPRWYKYY